jgi:hypothetical protein
MYVLCYEEGEYSDRTVSIVGVFDTIEMVQAAVDASTQSNGYYYASVLPDKNIEYDRYGVQEIRLKKSAEVLRRGREDVTRTHSELVAEFHRTQMGPRYPNDFALWLNERTQTRECVHT